MALGEGGCAIWGTVLSALPHDAEYFSLIQIS